MSLQVALEALTSDANRWRDVAEVLDEASGAAANLTLAPSQFSFAGATVYQTYETLRAHLQNLLEQGSENLNTGADELDQVRTEYETADQDSAHRLEGLWDWN